MYVYMYIYIYMYINISLSLSLYIYIYLYWALLRKGQKDGGPVWAKSGDLAQYYYHMLLARLGF